MTVFAATRNRTWTCGFALHRAASTTPSRRGTPTRSRTWIPRVGTECTFPCATGVKPGTSGRILTCIGRVETSDPVRRTTEAWSTTKESNPADLGCSQTYSARAMVHGRAPRNRTSRPTGVGTQCASQSVPLMEPLPGIEPESLPYQGSVLARWTSRAVGGLDGNSNPLPPGCKPGALPVELPSPWCAAVDLNHWPPACRDLPADLAARSTRTGNRTPTR